MEKHNTLRILCGGKVFDSSERNESPQFVDCIHIKATQIDYIGSIQDQASLHAIQRGAILQDVEGKYILPGFIDGHMHLLLLGQSIQKLSLESCKNLEDIRRVIHSYCLSHPDAKRILCKGWMHPMTNGEATAKMLEGLDERPIFIDSKDLHSTWCNEAALKELNVESVPDPVGGTVHRYEDGKPMGLISESANLNLVWPHLAKVASLEEKVVALEAALEAYTKAGYTGICDMAMDENCWEALLVLRQQGKLPLRIAAYWLILPSSNREVNLRQVDRAINLREKYNEATTPDLRVVGVKLICDGVIDACTAALVEPYDSTASPDPLWTVEMLEPVVDYAEKAGLQCALHAIGDLAIHNAINVIEKFGRHGSRHRIEHLELCSADDAQRLGKLAITASVQPVHADPAILKAWPTLLGERRCSRAFRYRDFMENRATLAIGTDSPTAPYEPMPNLYIATTRRSARETTSEVTVNESFALPLWNAINAYTHGVAYSCFAESLTGRLQPGLSADFVVVDMTDSTSQLLEASIQETWYRGEKIYDASELSSSNP
jgi:predicted amidohydrolase YtcJ